jgi:hypothetical protein
MIPWYGMFEPCRVQKTPRKTRPEATQFRRDFSQPCCYFIILEEFVRRLFQFIIIPFQHALVCERDPHGAQVRHPPVVCRVIDLSRNRTTYLGHVLHLFGVT